MVQPEGNIVKTYIDPDTGFRVNIRDAAYINKTPEELELIRENARRIAWNIAVSAEMRRMGLLPDNK